MNKLDWLVWMASFLGVLFISVEIGLGIAIGLAILIVIYESAFPNTALVGRIPGTTIWRNIKQYPNVRERTGKHMGGGSWGSVRGCKSVDTIPLPYVAWLAFAPARGAWLTCRSSLFLHSLCPTGPAGARPAGVPH